MGHWVQGTLEGIPGDIGVRSGVAGLDGGGILGLHLKGSGLWLGDSSLSLSGGLGAVSLVLCLSP